MWWSPCPSQSASPRSSREVLVLFSVQVLTLGARDYFRVCMWCVCERERKHWLAIWLWHRPLAHQLLAGQPCMHLQTGTATAARSERMQAMASSSSFLAFQEKGLRDVLQKPSKRKFPRSSRASPSLYLLLCLAAAAPKKVSVLSASLSLCL